MNANYGMEITNLEVEDQAEFKAFIVHDVTYTKLPWQGMKTTTIYGQNKTR